MTQLEQMETKSVATRLHTLFNEATRGQGGQQSVRRALGNAESPRNLGYPKFLIDGKTVE